MKVKAKINIDNTVQVITERLLNEYPALAREESKIRSLINSAICDMCLPLAEDLADQPRWVVLGPTGSGKTWLADRMGMSRSMPTQRSDNYFYTLKPPGDTEVTE